MNINVCKPRNNLLFKINITPEYYEQLGALLKIKKIVDKNFVRLGRPNDGGYVMVDNFNVSGGDIAYSFGINNDVSWDSDMVLRGYDVFMYDPTIAALPKENEKFHFFKAGISGITDARRSLDTLDSFIQANGHEDKTNMILKMDVEGAEWGFLSQVSSETLSRFDQMVFEFHSFIQSKSQDVMDQTYNCLRKINRTHSLVHLHANNYGAFVVLDDKIMFPDTLELTYVKTSEYELVDDENIFLPISLDQPCYVKIPDIPLGYWNKKFNNLVKYNE